jgi:ornithine cyclodeaminase/alanine dehydrogenase-like protein (mu-crystallin family)
MNPPVLILDDADVRQVVNLDDAVPTVELAFRKISLDEAMNVPRQRCQTDHVLLHVLPAAAKTLNAIGFKAYATGHFPKQSRIFLFDSKLGHLAAIVAGETIGDLRTGAAGAVAVKKLSRGDARTVGLIGAGRQAQMQLEAIGKVRKILNAKVYCPAEDPCTEFAREMTVRCGFDVQPVSSAEAAVREADIVITATTAIEPVLFGDWLADGCHVNLIGSNFLAKAEADVSVFRRTNLVAVDSREQAKSEAGDFVAALKANLFGWSDVLDLAHILTNRYPGRQAPGDITLFKSLGLGLQDVALAAKAVEKAKAAGLGRSVEI